ncbi:hypothetical protein MAPG_02238 [Magnaporthiopsis poae ATCC 64411]|uniref:Short-chain dehydrogenase/reductase SDR n=1 Tax=Magnaporthiopsis poae (strain ATCC 64411 / 73-15) TaxID=644358 RepID=A0A0C4DQU1_MAGP6|nr:hypothetical protein MAPG_02238 [Magnaporthiopsis poae ATCC 64411]
MSKPWALVVPSSRGIGQHLTRALLKRTNLPILATCRQDPEGTKAALLRDLTPPPPSSPSPPLCERLHLARVDVTDEASIRAAAAHAAETLFPRATHHLHLSFALPGILHVDKSAEAVDAGATLESFRVNTLGPLLLMKHFVPFLPRPSTATSSSPSLPPHAIWVNMTARVGSVADNNGQGGWYTYRATKAAVNSLTRTLDLQLRARTTVTTTAADTLPAFAVAYHPGTVRTDFSRDYWEGSERRGQLLDPEFAAERVLDVVLGLKIEQRGRIWDWTGNEIPP